MVAGLMALKEASELPLRVVGPVGRTWRLSVVEATVEKAWLSPGDGGWKSPGRELDSVIERPESEQAMLTGSHRLVGRTT